MGDVRMVHEGQRLPLGFKAGHHLARVHTRLDYLEGDLAADRMLLLRHEHNAETAFTNLLQELVRTDHRPGPLVDRLVVGCWYSWRGAIENTSRLLVSSQQAFDCGTQV